MPPSTSVTIAVIGTLLLMVLPEARGIKCYQCNSKKDPECANIPVSNATHPAPPSVARFLKTCNNGPAGEPAFCRKSYINVLNSNNGEGEERWVRACGWVRYKNPCYMFDDQDHHERVCQCFDDACNPAARPAPAPAAPLLLLAALSLAAAAAGR